MSICKKPSDEVGIAISNMIEDLLNESEQEEMSEILEFPQTRMEKTQSTPMLFINNKTFEKRRIEESDSKNSSGRNTSPNSLLNIIPSKLIDGKKWPFRSNSLTGVNSLDEREFEEYLMPKHNSFTNQKIQEQEAFRYKISCANESQVLPVKVRPKRHVDEKSSKIILIILFFR